MTQQNKTNQAFTIKESLFDKKVENNSNMRTLGGRLAAVTQRAGVRWVTPENVTP